MAVARVLAYVFQLKSATPIDYVPKPTDFDIPVEAQGENDEDEVGRDGN